MAKETIGFQKKTRNLVMGNEQLAKVPPQARDLEEAVLGAIMLEKEAINKVVDILKFESFYDERNGLIFSACCNLFSRNEPIDIKTVTNELRRMGNLERVGGPFYLVELTNVVTSTTNIEYHARLILEYALKREIISISNKAKDEAYEDTSDVFELLDKVQQDLLDLSEKNTRKNFLKVSDILKQTIGELEERSKQKDVMTGIPSGFQKIDSITSGWQRSDLIIVAARPGMGKTAFVVSAARNASVVFKKSVAIFSLEMSSVQLMGRIISAEAEIESEKIRKGDFTPQEWHMLHTRIKSLEDVNLYIDDTPSLSIMELKAKCRRLKAQPSGIDLIIIDYLQLMSGDAGTNKGLGNREQEIANISRSLKQLAKELNVPVIALSQLSRAVETRGGDKKPLLSDLRESGSIEQDADMVVFLYRPDYYKLENAMTDDGRSAAGMGEVIFAKNRHGSVGSVWLKFIAKFTKFADDEDNPFLNIQDFSNKAVTMTSGLSSFETDSTLTIKSKVNGDAQNNTSLDSNEVPF
ncbi:MAG: replicative DNA helicase [Cytophagales bacterium]